MTQKRWLYGLDLNDLTQVVNEFGLPKFAARQIADWLYNKRCRSIDDMTNLSLKARQALNEHFVVGDLAYCGVQESTDGTKKYLFPTLEGQFIESAYIPDRERATLCVSSQSGCRMGCRMCMTGKQGFQHNLTSGEILNQIRNIDESARLTNIVYMGMGEPLDNVDEVLRSLRIMTSPWGYGWSPTRITLSTVGAIAGLRRFLDETTVHLAVSLHNPFPEERRELMPAQNRNPIEDVIDLLHQYDWTHQRRVSFEYVMLAGVNDTPRHAKQIARLLKGIFCRMNLIRFHTIPDVPFKGSSEAAIERFKALLEKEGLITTIRASRGEDISAACGLLSTKELNKNKR